MPFDHYQIDRPNPSDFAEEDFERHRKQHYPRGYGPPDNSPDGPDPEMEMYDEHDPSRYVDSTYEDHSYQDPDDWHHDQKSGGILTQRDQWPDRVAGIRQAAHGRFTESELSGHDPKVPKAPVGGDVHRVKGLYGEDEDDPYDVYAKPSPDGKGWDVIKAVGR